MVPIYRRSSLRHLMTGAQGQALAQSRGRKPGFRLQLYGRPPWHCEDWKGADLPCADALEETSQGWIPELAGCR